MIFGSIDETAVARKWRAIKKVVHPWFRNEVHAFVDRLPSGHYTGEDIHHLAEAEGIIPHHHNAWGGVMNGLVGTKLQFTGEWEPMKVPQSNARLTPIYIKP